MERGLSLATFGVLVVAAAVFIMSSSALLPPVVASGFGLDGTADNYMHRSNYLLLMSALTVVMPIAVVVSAVGLARRGSSALSLPNRDHWLAPQHRLETAAWLGVHMARFGSILILFGGAAQALVLYANMLQPPQIDLPALGGCTVAFLVATALWARTLHARFGRPR